MTDLRLRMDAAAQNPPLFLEALYEACEAIRTEAFFAPDVAMINDACRRFDIGYELQPPELRLRDTSAVIVEVPERPVALAERSAELLQNSLQRAQELLEQGRGREAVQETLWLLETVTTGFRGLETEVGTVEGNYFNRIVRELRNAHAGTTLGRVLEWASVVHGYLSSSSGGGIRHGLDLRNGNSL